MKAEEMCVTHLFTFPLPSFLPSFLFGSGGGGSHIHSLVQWEKFQSLWLALIFFL
jgi:hypothetical protein